MVFRAIGEEKKISHATFVILELSTRAFAHILGRDVLGQKRPNVGTCVPKLELGMLILSQVISA